MHHDEEPFEKEEPEQRVKAIIPEASSPRQMQRNRRQNWGQESRDDLGGLLRDKKRKWISENRMWRCFQNYKTKDTARETAKKKNKCKLEEDLFAWQSPSSVMDSLEERTVRTAVLFLGTQVWRLNVQYYLTACVCSERLSYPVFEPGCELWEEWELEMIVLKMTFLKTSFGHDGGPSDEKVWVKKHLTTSHGNWSCCYIHESQ